MFIINAEFDRRQLRQAQAAVNPKQFAFATSVAVNALAKKVEANERAVMPRNLDRPTPYTLRSLRRTSATKKNSYQASVWFKDRDYGGQKGNEAGAYLQAQVHGGERRQKGFERRLMAAGWLGRGYSLIPARNAPMDAYGNVQRSVYNKFLSALGALSGPGFFGNATGSRRSRKKGNAKRFFYGEVGGQRGVWERIGSAFGEGVKPLFVETRGLPRYRVRFPFFKIAENTVEANYERIYKSAFEYALATARPSK